MSPPYAPLIRISPPQSGLAFAAAVFVFCSALAAWLITTAILSLVIQFTKPADYGTHGVQVTLTCTPKPADATYPHGYTDCR